MLINNINDLLRSNIQTAQNVKTALEAAYDAKANELAGFFNKSFEKYASGASDEIKGAAPTAN